jgi:hypothetical protein
MASHVDDPTLETPGNYTTTRDVTLHGTVANVAAGFAFFSVPMFGDFFCPGNKIASRLLRKGDPVTFEVAFNAMGPTVSAILDQSAGS